MKPLTHEDIMMGIKNPLSQQQIARAWVEAIGSEAAAKFTEEMISKMYGEDDPEPPAAP